jgi:hypothetical protein
MPRVRPAARGFSSTELQCGHLLRACDEEVLAARGPKTIDPPGEVALRKRGSRHVLGVPEPRFAGESQHLRRREERGEWRTGRGRARLRPLEPSAILGFE